MSDMRGEPGAGRASGAERPIDPRAEIGEFLRSRRARVGPKDVGLPVFGRQRRVPGLRREELAQLAGVSVAYLTRLEQGRAGNVSAEVLEAVARALRLTDAERAHLRHLVACQRKQPPPGREPVRPALREMVASWEGMPAYVTGPRSDILAWNRMAAALFGDWERLPSWERNWVRLVFLRPDHRGLFADGDTLAADAVGALRLYAGCYPDDPLLVTLVGELSVRSEEFRRLWARHDVKDSHHGVKRLRHPLVGELTLSYESFRLPDDPEQSLIVYHASPGSAAADNLRLLASWSADAMATKPYGASRWPGDAGHGQVAGETSR